MRRFAPLVLLALATSTFLAPSAGAASLPIVGTATVTGAQDLPRWGSLPQFQEGGFSGLYPTGTPGHYWTVSDRGPNGEPVAANGNRRPFLAPGFTPSIYEIAVDLGTQQVSIVQRIPLHLPVGSVDPLRATVGGPANHITGLANTLAVPTANVPTQDEVPTTDTDGDGDVDTADANFGLDPYGLDTEGIAVDPRDGSFWLVDEYRPSIIHVAPDGTLLQRYTPQGQSNANLGAAWAAVPLSDVLPAIYSTRRENRGFEGVAISTGSGAPRLYAVVQNPLNTACSGDTGIPGETYQTTNNRSATRIAEIDISNPASPVLVGDYVYQLDTTAAGVPEQPTQQRISDLWWAGPGRLVVDERDDTDGGSFKRIYEVDLGAATNLVGLPAATLNCLDALRPTGVAARGVTPGTKTLLADLGATTASPAYPISKLEGVVTLPSGHIATINDNDFAVNGPRPTLFVEYGQDPPPVVPEAPYAVLLSVGGMAALGVVWVVRRATPVRVGA